MFRSVVNDRNALSRKRQAPPGPDCCLTTSFDKTQTPSPTIGMVNEGADKTRPRHTFQLPEARRVREYEECAKGTLPHAAINHNPNVRLWRPPVGCGNILPPCPV
jgi:hypothetical protein